MKFNFTCLLFFICLYSYADDLLWLPYGQAVIAKDFLNDQKQVIDYCSCCNDAPMNLINIDYVYIKKVENRVGYTITKELYEVIIKGKKSNGDLVTEAFDLAYLYILIDKDAVCVGEHLEFHCGPCIPIFTWPFDKEGYQTLESNKNNIKFSFLIEKNDKNNIEFWLKSVSKITSKNKKIKSTTKMIISYVEINCNNKEYNIQETINYDNKGNATKHIKNEINFSKIIPGTVIKEIYDLTYNKN